MKSLSNYQTWDQAFFHLGAKGSPNTPVFEFSKEEFFVKGINYSVKSGARTFSAFAHWVNTYGKNLNVNNLTEHLTLLTGQYDQALLGYYLDLINQESFSSLYKFTQKLDSQIILHKVKTPDELLLKWGYWSKPLGEPVEKYLILDNPSNPNRIF